MKRVCKTRMFGEKPTRVRSTETITALAGSITHKNRTFNALLRCKFCEKLYLKFNGCSSLQYVNPAEYHLAQDDIFYREFKFNKQSCVDILSIQYVAVFSKTMWVLQYFFFIFFLKRILFLYMYEM